MTEYISLVTLYRTHIMIEIIIVKKRTRHGYLQFLLFPMRMLHLQTRMFAMDKKLNPDYRSSLSSSTLMVEKENPQTRYLSHQQTCSSLNSVNGTAVGCR